MARGYGSGSKLAAKRGAAGQTWGTGTVPTLGSSDRYPFKSYNVDRVREVVPDDSITGKAERAISQYTNKRLAGSAVAIVDPRQAVPLLSAFLLGTAGTPTALTGGDTGAYKHLLKWGAQSTQEGLWCSIGADNLADAIQHQYLKVNRRVITGRTGGYLEAAFDLIGRGEDRTVSSSSWTYANDPSGNGARILLMRQAVLRLNAQSGAALDSTHVVYPVSFELEVLRNFGEDFAQAGENEEPLPSDFGEVMLRFSFHQLTSELLTLFRDSVDSGAALKADLVVTGDDLIIGGGAQKFAWKAYLPNLRIVEAPFSIDGPQPVPFRVALSAHAAIAAPTGFTAGYTEAIQEEWYNARSTDYLA